MFGSGSSKPVAGSTHGLQHIVTAAGRECLAYASDAHVNGSFFNFAIARRVGRFLERLCRYIARPAISEKRLSLTGQGKVRYELKTPYRDGTTRVIFIPGFLPSTLRAGLRLFKIAPGDFVNQRHS